VAARSSTGGGASGPERVAAPGGAAGSGAASGGPGVAGGCRGSDGLWWNCDGLCRAHHEFLFFLIY